MHTKNNNNITYMLYIKNIHKGKTEELRRWLAGGRVLHQQNYKISPNSNTFWMEEFFYELYFSAKSQCINIFLNTLMEGLDYLILHEKMCDLAIIKVMLKQGFIWWLTRINSAFEKWSSLFIICRSIVLSSAIKV